MIATRWLVLLTLMFASIGCRRGKESVATPTMPANLPLSRPTAVDADALPAVVRANNSLAIDLYQRLRSRPGNRLVSPACVSAGLALLRAGAGGETASQIERVMHRPDGIADLDLAYAGLVRELNADAEDRQVSYQVRLANALWVRADYPLADDYRTTLRDCFAARVESVDFASHPDDVVRRINAWTAERTGGKIATVVGPGDLSPETKLVLSQALYFRANWRQHFLRKRTSDEPFRTSKGRTVVVPMMNEHSYAVIHGYYDGGTFQALSIPCGTSHEFRMVVLLPAEPDALSKLEANLTLEWLDALGSKLRTPEEIEIALPKFRIRAELDLGPVLANMGMPLAFDPAGADFSGVAGPGRGLFVASIRQSTVIDVHEEGIEAASAMSTLIPDAYGEVTPVFRADHPFLFLVRDTRTGCLLFLGRVDDPTDRGEAAETARPPAG